MDIQSGFQYVNVLDFLNIHDGKRKSTIKKNTKRSTIKNENY